MTAGGLAQDISIRTGLNSGSLADRLVLVVQLLRPSDGWIALILLAFNLMVVVGSVDQANWVATPNLALILTMAMITGLVLSRLPIWGALVFPVGLGVGMLVIVWQLTSQMPGDGSVADAGQLWHRLELWFTAAKAGSINIDQVPFSFGLLVVLWLLGYVAVWVFSRYRAFWGVFILGGAGLLSNLTFLPPEAGIFLGMYLLTALLLIARVQSVRRQQEWSRRNVQFDVHLGALGLSDSFILATVVLIVAFSIPLGHELRPVHSAYESMRSPMTAWEDDFNRLFAGIPARRPIGYRVWGDVMAFQGTIKPTTTVVLQVESPTPMYWKARTYGTYTSKGWVSDGTTFKSLDWAPTYSAPQASLERFEVSYSVTPNYASKSLFAGDQVLATDRNVQVETYDSPIYTLDLPHPEAVDTPPTTNLDAESSFSQLMVRRRGLAEDATPGQFGALPPGLAEAAFSLNGLLKQGGGLAADTALEASLPPDLRLVDVSRIDGKVQQVQVADVLPARPDILSLRSTKGKIKAGEVYTVTSSVSVAEAAELEAAGTDYPTWALTKYTQLPVDLPQRVRDLAADLTNGAATPYGKAKAIESYLSTFPYTLEVDPPPFNADGVDHFLFTLRKGYSEYFASAMTVMLRSVNVPARLATGYTVGDKATDQQLYFVRDSHAHGWVEVFFPHYGWITFEPTPGASLPKVSLPGLEELAGESPGGSQGVVQDACEESIDICNDENDASPAPDTSTEITSWPGSLLGILPWLIGVLGSLVLLGGTASLLWNRYLTSSENPRIIYRRLVSLGALGSVGQEVHQTPYQYRERLQQAMPDYREEVSVLIDAYVRNRYGTKEPAWGEASRLTRAWLRLRVPLLRRVIRWRMP